MKKLGLYVKNMNAAPEIRETVPGYLIRSGETSTIDANFGKDTGAGAVVLLMNGITGVTVTGVEKGTVTYIPTKEAIKQRFVDENMVAFYENMGVCFGRKPTVYKTACEIRDKANWCYL